MRSASFLAALLALAAFRADANCGTEDFGHDVTHRIVDMTAKKKAMPVTQSKLLPAIITMDTYICVVLSNGEGDVPDATFDKQMTVFNQSFAFSGSRLRFQLKGIQRVEFPNATLDSYVNQLGMACRHGGLDALNIFIVPFINGNADGVGKPFFLTGNTVTDGIYLLTSTLPGADPEIRQDLGITAVHEAGHWLGLMHPFQALPPYEDDPCNPANPNDYISDTAQMNASTPESDFCPVNFDTCPLLPGFDPTDNIMDYGAQYDVNGVACKTRFTPQQVQRMQDVFEFYRVKNEICASNEFQFELQIKFDDFPEFTSWDIKYANGTIFHQSVTDGLGSAYDFEGFANQTITAYHCLPRGRSYIFDIYSSFGQGIAAPGYYRVTIDGVVLAQGGQDFKKKKSIRFPVVKISVGSSQCFSHANTVYVDKKGTIYMSDLQIGDMVKSADGTLAKVYSFGHYQRSVKAQYLQIHAKGLTKPIEISKDHLLFVGRAPVPASAVTPGTMLDSESGPNTHEVTKIKLVTRTGAYAPFTTSGSIMVSGIAASSYVTLQHGSNVLVLGVYNTHLSMHWLAHVFQSPQRLACFWKTAYCIPDAYTEEGLSKWIELPLTLSTWLLAQNGVVIAAFFVPAFCPAMLIYLVEWCCLHICFFLIAAAPIFAMYFLVSTEARGRKPKGKTA